MADRADDAGGTGGADLLQSLDATAESMVLADASDPSTFADVAIRLRALERFAPPGGAGDGVRETIRSAQAIVERFAAGGSADVASDLTALMSCFETARGGLLHPSPGSPGVAATALADDADLVADFVVRAVEHLDAADTNLLTLEREPTDRETIDATFREFHTLKGMAGFLSFNEIADLAHRMETLLDGPRRGESVLAAEAFDTVFSAIDQMRGLVDVHARRPATPVAGPRQGLPPDDSAAKDAPVPAARPATPAAERSGASPGAPESIVRVEEERLDRLVDAIGELVIAESMTSAAARSDSDAWALLGDTFAQLDKITRELQQMATSLRMVPLRATFRHMARLVRDLAKKQGKQIDLETEGEDIELDKAMVDLIGDPLIHILRNAIDHGLEGPDERAALGKAPIGRLRLRAFHAGGSVVVEVSDDGRGFDTERILACARERGVVRPDESPSEREVLSLVFSPGFTTAAEVTDLSGRGVGMDVVKRAVEAVRGQIDISTEPGRGATISIRLPLTLAIIDGMVVRVGAERYIVPMLSVELSVRPAEGQVTTVLGRGRMLSLGDTLVPMVGLADLLSIQDAEPDPTRGIVVVVSDNGDRVGLAACELLGQQQIVIKALGDSFEEARGVAGGAIMPDGQVGLILDVGDLVRLARS